MLPDATKRAADQALRVASLHNPFERDGRFRRSAEAGDVSEGLPLTAREQSFARQTSEGKVCPESVIGHRAKE